MGIIIIVSVIVSFFVGYFTSRITRPALGDTEKEALPPVSIEIPVEGDFDFVELEPLAPAPGFVKWEEIPIFRERTELEELQDQLRSDIYNGDLWEAVETFKTLKELGEDPSLLEYITVLQDFPAWGFKKIAPKQALKEYSPLGTVENMKKEACRLFIRMAAHNYRHKNLLLTAACIEAAHNALHTEIKQKYFALLGGIVHSPFSQGHAASALDGYWPNNYK